MVAALIVGRPGVDGGGHDDAGIENCPSPCHRPAHGSRICWSICSRSNSRSASAAPAQRAPTSSKRRQLAGAAGNEPDAWPPRDRDGHVFAALGSPDELSCPLSEFAKSERRHTSRVGPALLDAYPSADEDELWATVRAAFSNLGISDSALPAEGGAFDLSDEALNTLHAALSTATTAC